MITKAESRKWAYKKLSEIISYLTKEHGLTKYQAKEMAMDIMRTYAGIKTKHC